MLKAGLIMAVCALPLMQQGHALESVANNASIRDANVESKFAAKLAALAAIVEAIGKELNKVKACNENSQFYDADSDKCVDVPETTASGAIAGFLTNCPSGCREYTAARGHFLVGHGNGGYAGNYSRLGTYVDAKGKRGYGNVVLKKQNLPSSGGSTLKTYYNYLVRKASGDKYTNVRTLACASGARCSKAGNINLSGGGSNAALENRPPFRVVKWCRKS